MTDPDVIVLGGGAAGLFCARVAALRGRRVLVLERGARPGNKILISGGGRCNFTNLGATAANYVTSGSPHFPKSALARFTPADFLALVERHGIAWHEKKLGQLFCDLSSKQILRMLEDECADAGVEVRTGVSIAGVERVADPPRRWRVAAGAEGLEAESLVVATGGLSFPKLGATPQGLEIAHRLGVPLVATRPGLVPLTFPAETFSRFTALSGLSIDCRAAAGADTPAFRENVLFTHRGLSGPAILQVSSHRAPGGAIRLDLLPGIDVPAFLEAARAGGRDLRSVLRQALPERFVDAWLEPEWRTRRVAQLSRREIAGLAGRLSAWELVPDGDEGYPKAEVMVGGVDTAALSSKTLECRDLPGLYFIGEVVDVTGWLGGYNFQWAWASGHAAGQAA